MSSTKSIIIILTSAIVLWILSLLFDKYAGVNIHATYIFLVVLIILMLGKIWEIEHTYVKVPLGLIGIYYICTIGLIEFNQGNDIIYLANKIVFALTLILFIIIYIKERMQKKEPVIEEPVVQEENGN